MDARSITGSPVHDLAGADPERTVVTVEGLEMSLAQAIKSGFVSRTANGGFAPAGQKAAPAAKAAAKGDPNQSAPLFASDSEGFKVLSKMADSVGLDAAENAFIKLLGARAAGKDASQAIQSIGEAISTNSKDVAIDASNAMIDELVTRIEDHLDAMGVSGNEALNYYIQNSPSEAANRMISLFRGHSVMQHLAAIRNASKRAKAQGYRVVNKD